MPNRIISSTKIQKGECNGKIKNNVFSVFDKNGAREYAMRKIEFLSPVRRIRTNVKQNQQNKRSTNGDYAHTEQYMSEVYILIIL